MRPVPIGVLASLLLLLTHPIYAKLGDDPQKVEAIYGTPHKKMTHLMAPASEAWIYKTDNLGVIVGYWHGKSAHEMFFKSDGSEFSAPEQKALLKSETGSSNWKYVGIVFTASEDGNFWALKHGKALLIETKEFHEKSVGGEPPKSKASVRDPLETGVSAIACIEQLLILICIGVVSISVGAYLSSLTKKSKSGCDLTCNILESMKTYDIRFGTAFAVDQFGFVRRGKLNITDTEVRLEGPKHWSAVIRVGVFLAMTVLPFLLFGAFVGIFLALVIIHYGCASPGSIQWPKNQVQQVFRLGRTISFLAPEPDSNKLRKALLKASDKTVAVDIERALKALKLSG